MKRLAFCVFAISMGFCGCQLSHAPAERMLPRDSIHDAVYERLGNPDKIYGSGRSFLKYSFKNGQTLTLIIGGNEIVGAEIPRLDAESPNKSNAGDVGSEEK